jgi:prepilin-type N-terminal cleavage/methylation domain-containing protein
MNTTRQSPVWSPGFSRPGKHMPDAGKSSPHFPAEAGTPNARSGFTLIEIMLVVGLMALIAATAVPNIYQLTKKEGLRRAVADLKDVCGNARARAIFSGQEVSVMFYPGERLFAISSGGGREFDPVTGETKAEPMVKPGSGTTGIFPEDVSVDMLDINQHSALEYDWARVRFYPNGTCEELVINLSSRDNPGLWLKLDPATSILIIGEPP